MTTVEECSSRRSRKKSSSCTLLRTVARKVSIYYIYLFLVTVSSAVHWSAIGYTSGPNVANVFRMFSCNFTMAREYFTILGRVMKFPNSMKLLNGTNIFQVLTQIGSVPTLDYLTRLLFTSLSFTDGGVMSR